MSSFRFPHRSIPSSCFHIHFLGNRWDTMLMDVCDVRLDEGFRLTYGGLDFLALRSFSVSKPPSVAAVGNKIGVGKESDIYVVKDQAGEERVLKLHRSVLRISQQHGLCCHMIPIGLTAGSHLGWVGSRSGRSRTNGITWGRGVRRAGCTCPAWQRRRSLLSCRWVFGGVLCGMHCSDSLVGGL